MQLFRASGILLHPTSLPGPYGIGDLGKECFTFIDFLILTDQKIWQLNPLGPTGYGDSPYQSFSSFAGNPLLINLEKIFEKGWLLEEDLPEEALSSEKVDYAQVQKLKNSALKKAYQRFLKSEETLEHKKFFNFCKQEHEWLEDFSLFMALKEEYQGVAWSQWPKELARRETNALNGAKKRLEEAMLQHQFFQYLFFSQWKAVRAYSNQQGIQILGDLPLFPSYDSVEVWTHPEIFYLNEERAMTVLAGVPPDYFSEEGQLWGNPLYRWEVLKETRYEWWKKRIQGSLRLFDLLRLDHFRGFESYWEIPATAKTAKEGRWIAGPKEDFFSSLEESYGPLPFIAEDLGIIPKEVERLREMFGIPGMKILQFAFNGTAKHPYLPHHFEKNCVVYTGTHDNSPLAQWWSSCQESEQEFVLKYLGKSSLLQIHWEFIRLAMMSSAHFALFPLQDILGLGEEARMNTPGKAENNWTWRFQADQVSTEVVQRLSLLTKTSGRD